jgi:FtsZ-binding cell division protein ZapB
MLLSFSTLAQNYNAGVGSGTGGNYNVMVGPNAGRVTTGTDNSFLGYSTGYSNTTGSGNSFLGSYAGQSNTTGSGNSFFGTFTGKSNTTGSANSFMGEGAGSANTTGFSNSFLGSGAGRSNTTGFRNSFMGYQVGFRNTTGTLNNFIGYEAGWSNTSGSSNSFLGSNAGYSNTTGDGNSFVGNNAGSANKTGSNNTFLGINAGNANTTGKENSFVGLYTGSNNRTGSNNLFLGSYANVVKVTRGPAIYNASAIGNRAYVTASNSLVLGSINKVNGATASTHVGIGTSAPAYLLHVNGAAAKPGSGSWTVASDKRLKKNISNFTEGLNILEKIKPVWFEYNGEAGMPTEKKYVGILAQEMQKIAPYTVGEFTYQDSTGKQTQYLDYDANALTYILVNSVKELKQENTNQQGRIDELQQENQSVKAENAALMQRLAQLEAAVGKLTGEPIKVTDNAAQLYQNAPNPTEGTTIIGYFLPKEAVSAQLKIYSVTGVEVQSIELKERGKGQVSISVGQLADGQYIYHLLVDGQSIASKKLLLNR